MGMFSWLTADTEESVLHIASGAQDRPVYFLLPNGQEPICEPDYSGQGEFFCIDAYEWLARTNLPALGITSDRFQDLPSETLRMIGIDLESATNQFYGVLHKYGFTDVIPYDETLPFPIKLSYSPNAVYEDLPASKPCPNQGYADGPYRDDEHEADVREDICQGRFSWQTADTNEPIWCIDTDLHDYEKPVYLLQPDGLPAICEHEYNGDGRFGGVDVNKWLDQHPNSPLKFSFDPNAVYEDLPASPECPYRGYFTDEYLDSQSGTDPLIHTFEQHNLSNG